MDPFGGKKKKPLSPGFGPKPKNGKFKKKPPGPPKKAGPMKGGFFWKMIFLKGKSFKNQLLSDLIKRNWEGKTRML